ncbi:MAG: ATP-binding cassette domain-containing protein, partial [Planctomycetia bacterium]|nr:ATP-binding cassette domain-containing protein [Planctomycetia bacterium]
GNARKYEDVTNQGKKAMKRAKNIEKRIEIIIKKEEAKKPFIEKERKLSLHDSKLKNKIVLSVEKLSKIFEDNFILDDINFEVRNGDRLSIKGKNGSGKSTLLKIITNNMTQSGGLFNWAPKVKIGYYAQEYENLDLNSTILEEVIQGNIREQTQARIILGCFNIEKDDVNRKISTLSIGEKSKTALAKIIYSDSNVLVLDEPTNHLEISAREAFEDALMKFNGTVIFVSHDRYFSDKIECCEMML